MSSDITYALTSDLNVLKFKFSQLMCPVVFINISYESLWIIKWRGSKSNEKKTCAIRKSKVKFTYQRTIVRLALGQMMLAVVGNISKSLRLNIYSIKFKLINSCRGMLGIDPCDTFDFVWVTLWGYVQPICLSTLIKSGIFSMLSEPFCSVVNFAPLRFSIQ